MKINASNIILVLTVALLIASCANRGRPSGGEKDTSPPIIIKSIPKNYSTQFNANEIKIYFDEFIKFKDISKQLIVSPPMNTPLDITPLSSASKYIKIKILDTLKPNTTYAINFGNSIVDNNEENPFPFFKYVFSTGDFIDSLQVKGSVFDAINSEPDSFISVGLYPVDSTFNDSIIYKQAPRYLTNTLDSTTNYSIENIKAGKYFLIALKDKNRDHKFQQISDKIGFYNEFISLPADTTPKDITLFKEFPDYKASRPTLDSKQKLIFGYQGDYKKTAITVLSKTSKAFKTTYIKSADSDSLFYFYKPKLKLDSLVFKVANNTTIDTFTVKIRDRKLDSLRFSSATGAIINLEDDFKLSANIPITKINKKHIKIINKDSVTVPFKTKLDTLHNIAKLSFKKEEIQQYKITFLPEAITPFFETQSDTLTYNVKTKSELEYGSVRIKLQNAKYPILAQLLLSNGDETVKAEQYIEKEQFIDFRFLNPGNYIFRIILDKNKNGKYDTGNYLKKIQPETVKYMDGIIELSAGFEMTFDFILN